MNPQVLKKPQIEPFKECIAVALKGSVAALQMADLITSFRTHRKLVESLVEPLPLKGALNSRSFKPEAPNPKP